jgi:hypothetical protein
MNTNTSAIPEKENIKDTAEDLLKHAADYVETFYERTVLTLTSKTVKSGASLINGLLVLVLGLIVFFFLNFALAWWLGQVLDSRALGFLVLGGFYLLVLIIMIAARKTFLNLFRNMLTKLFYD